MIQQNIIIRKSVFDKVKCEFVKKKKSKINKGVTLKAVSGTE